MRALTLAAMLLAGCEMTSWEAAPMTHSCTPEAMERVKTETEWCTAKAGYTQPYCYGAAIMRICERRKASH